MKEISHSAREWEATGSITSCSYFLFFAPTLRCPLFQLSSSLRFSPLLACPPIFSISLYLYLRSHMRLRPKSSLLKPTWPKSKYSQLHVLVNKSRGPCQTSKAHLSISHANKILFSFVYFYSPRYIFFFFFFFFELNHFRLT